MAVVIFAIIALMACSLFFCSCSGESEKVGQTTWFDPGNETGQFTMTLLTPGANSKNNFNANSRVLPTGTATLKVTIDGEKIASSIIQATDISTGTGPFTMTVSDVPVGLNEALIQILDASSGILAQRRHGFYMTAGGTAGPGAIHMGVAVKSDGACEPSNITVPEDTILYFENWDTVNNRTVKLNASAMVIGPITKVAGQTVPNTPKVYSAMSYTFSDYGTYNYDSGYGAPGSVIVVLPGRCVYGTVTRSGDGAPLKGVQVAVNSVFSISDANGKYKLKQLATGSQNIIARKYAFANYDSSVTVLEDTPVLMDITMSRSPQWCNTYIDGDYYKRVRHTGGGSYIMVGSRGMIRRLHNNGNDIYWQNSGVSGLSDELKNVCFANSSYGWVVGSNGRILYTSNGGTTWNAQTSGTAQALEGVSFVDTVNGWVVGGGSTVIHTTDGGANWTSQDSGSTASFYCANFLNSNLGWVVGTSGAVLKTTDGGANWTSQTTPAANNYYSVYFLDSDKGWITGSSGNSYYTTNSGANWTSQNSYSAGNNLLEIFMFDQTLGWIAGGSGSYSAYNYTTDGGNVWNWPALSNMFGYNSIRFKDSNNGIMVGNTGIISGSTDGGKNWYDINNFFNYRQVYGICFIDTNNGWLCGKSGKLAKTTDGGVHWNKMTSATGNDLESISIVDSNTGWFVGLGPVSYKTTNGGAGWFSQNTNPPGGSSFYGVHFVNSQTGWIVGGVAGNSVVRSTTNGGTNWTSQNANTTVFFNGVFAADTNNCWVVGNSGVIRATTDGGATWTSQDSLTSTQILRSVYFLDSLNGWVAGNGGIIRKTTNGGLNWTSQNPGNSEAYYGIAFVDSNTGWAVASNEKIIYTTDGGANWASQSTYGYNQLYCVSAKGAYAWVGGIYGYIAKYPEQ